MGGMKKKRGTYDKDTQILKLQLFKIIDCVLHRHAWHRENCPFEMFLATTLN